MQQFAVLQLTGCAGCEVSLLNVEEWLEEYELVYMPLVISANSIPDVDILLVSGGVRTDEDLYPEISILPKPYARSATEKSTKKCAPVI